MKTNTSITNEWYRLFCADETYNHLLDAISEYKPKINLFACFKHCLHNKVKVVIIDPTINPTLLQMAYAHGIAFHEKKHKILPTSPTILESVNSTNLPQCDLVPWIKQGVLLLHYPLYVHYSEKLRQCWQCFVLAFLRTLVAKNNNIILSIWEPRDPKNDTFSGKQEINALQKLFGENVLHLSCLSEMHAHLQHINKKLICPIFWSLSDRLTTIKICSIIEAKCDYEIDTEKKTLTFPMSSNKLIIMSYILDIVAHFSHVAIKGQMKLFITSYEQASDTAKKKIMCKYDAIKEKIHYCKFFAHLAGGLGK